MGRTRFDEDVQTIVDEVLRLSAEMGNGKMSEARAANWLIREGGRSLLPQLKKQAKETKR